MIKALIFDFGNVVTTNVLHYVNPEKDRAYQTQLGLTMDQIEKGWNASWPLIAVGKVTEDEFWRIFLEKSGSKIKDVEIPKTIWRKYQAVFPEMINLIMRLRNRYPLIGCTNNGKEWVEYYKRQFHLDAYFDAIINSADVGIRKPDPLIYQKAVEMAGTKPEEIVFVDNSIKEIEGAKKISMQTVLFENARQLENELKTMGIDTSILDISDRHHSFYWQTDRKINELQIKHIFLARHTFFDRENAEKALESGMGMKVKDLTEPIKSGSINSVVKAVMADGTRVIMRMHPNAVKNGYFWAEKAIADSAMQAGVPTYKTYCIDVTKKEVPFDFMIISTLPGKNMKLIGPFSPEVDRKLIEDTGRLLALTHSVRTEKYGYFDNDQAKSSKLIGIHDHWLDHVFASFEDNLDYLVKKQSLSDKERHAINTIFEKNKSKLSCDSPRLIHNDLADWNQLTDGNKITGFIDWDEAFSGDPVCDFSAYSVFFDDTRIQNLKKGYETITKLPDDFEEKFHLYRLRYIISKYTLRTKRHEYEDSEFVKNMLAYSKRLLKEELLQYERP